KKVCTRAIWMEQGRPMYDGPAEEAVAKYMEAQGLNKKKRVGNKKRRPERRKQNAGTKKANDFQTTQVKNGTSVPKENKASSQQGTKTNTNKNTEAKEKATETNETQKNRAEDRQQS